MTKIGRASPDITSLVERVWPEADEPTNMPATIAAEVRRVRLIDMGECFLLRLVWCGLGLITYVAPNVRFLIRRSNLFLLS